MRAKLANGVLATDRFYGIFVPMPFQLRSRLRAAGMQIGLAPLFSALSLFLAAHAAGQSPASPADSQTATEIMETTRQSIVVIEQIGREGRREGIGAGFVVNSEGLIATSLHVIGEGREISVSFADGRRVPVSEIYAWDRKLDLAVLRVRQSDLPRLRLGDSDRLKQGAPVVAIGNPRGLSYSIVQGVVSAIREFEAGPMIQLAIPIEPGNSGGPLLDMRGRVQGILNIKSLVTENLGFAIPINALKPLLDKPNTVAMDRWQAIGALNEALWKPVMGAQWRQRGGMVLVDGTGDGFGGRSLCLSRQEVPDMPFEISVSVRLDDEAGAAGLVFGSDGADRHYGFYPSAGRLRVTRFNGPTVFTWEILRQIDSPYYRPGEWNSLRVRVEPKKIACYVNDHLVTELAVDSPPAGLAGLAKFRDTRARFKGFHLIGSSPAAAVEPAPGITELSDRLEQLFKAGDISDAPLDAKFLEHPEEARTLLLAKALDLDRQAAKARLLARELQQKGVATALQRVFETNESNIDLFTAALLIGRMETPDLDLDAYHAELDRMVHEARSLWQGEPDNRAKLDLLKKYVFEQKGYYGSRSDYYNEANSFIKRVMDDREGIPITLSVLFMEMGRRLGITHLEGMPFPGHFMVRFSEPGSDDIYIDVFDGGRYHSKDDLFSLIERHSEVPLLQEHFKPATKKEIVLRILQNVAALRTEDARRTLAYLDLIIVLEPGHVRERWRRTGLLLQAGERVRAREELKWFVDHQPDGFDRDRILEMYRQLE